MNGKTYTIVCINELADFQKEVNAYLFEGWELVGGVSTVNSKDMIGNSSIYFAQALMIEEKTNS